MRSRTAVLAAMLAIMPIGARSADLVVWWEEGYYAQEDEAVREIIAAFEEQTGNQVDLAFYPQVEMAIGSGRHSRPGSRPISPTARTCFSRNGCTKTGL
jgi:ABC-type glycerol-3-phosphate transport system substrate-binding protein